MADHITRISGLKWFAYCGRAFHYFGTPAEARARAKRAILEATPKADCDSWPDYVENICYGVVTEHARTIFNDDDTERCELRIAAKTPAALARSMGWGVGTVLAEVIFGIEQKRRTITAISETMVVGADENGYEQPLKLLDTEWRAVHPGAAMIRPAEALRREATNG